MWTGGLPYLNRLPHLPRAPHLHVNRTVKAVYSGKGNLPGLYVIAAIGVSKQWKGGHGSVQSYGSLTLFLRKGYLLFQWISIDAGHMGENSDSFCAAAKIIPDRASVCTQELMWLHNCCDGAKLWGADLESRALHIGYFCAMLWCSVNTCSTA